MRLLPFILFASLILGGCANVLGLPGYNAPPYRLNFSPTTSLVPADQSAFAPPEASTVGAGSARAR